MLLKVLAAASAATLLAGAAYAQDQAAPDTSNPSASPSAPAPAQPSAPADSGSGGVSAGASGTSTSSAGYNVGVPQTDPATGNQIVTNGPVPDTRANRAAYGQPDSRAGRRTRAKGN